MKILEANSFMMDLIATKPDICTFNLPFSCYDRH